MKDAIHFSGLNGVRAIAALAVVFSHSTLSLGLFGLNPFVFGKYADGNPKSTLLAGFGVSIFFALSGFLITYLLLVEKEKNQISIKKFYTRRILRIWPLYYLYLTLAVATIFLFGMEYQPGSLAYYVFLLANVPFIIGSEVPLLGHYWSLGVEEQFYALWPHVIKRSNRYVGVAGITCIVLILVKGLMRWLQYEYAIDWPYTAVHVTRFQCMLIGALGAILYFNKSSWICRIDNAVVQLICWIVLALAGFNHFHIVSFLDNEIIATIATCIIIGQIERKNRIINLENSFFDFIGKISFGIYVWHPLVIYWMSKMFITLDQIGNLTYLTVYALIFFLTITIAYISYQYFEKIFLKMKERFSVISTWPDRI